MLFGYQEGRGHWTVNFTGTQSFIIFNYLICWLKNFGYIFYGCFKPCSFQTLQPIILIHRRGNFVYNYWGFIYKFIVQCLNPKEIHTYAYARTKLFIEKLCYQKEASHLSSLFVNRVICHHKFV